MGIAYEWEKPLGQCSVDFFLTDYNIVIECDGTYWHQGRAERDKKRDAKLIEAFGVRIYRFTDKQIYAGVNDLLVNILTP